VERVSKFQIDIDPCPPTAFYAQLFLRFEEIEAEFSVILPRSNCSSVLRFPD
jgi:hypothetical protein